MCFYDRFTNENPNRDQIEDPSAWKYGRTGHFEWTLVEVEDHICPCPWVEHPSGPSSRI